jgi:hypothetical protein
MIISPSCLSIQEYQNFTLREWDVPTLIIAIQEEYDSYLYHYVYVMLISDVTLDHKVRDEPQPFLLRILTDIDELDSVLLDGAERRGDVLQVVMLVGGPPVPRRLERMPPEGLHQRAQPHPGAQILRQVRHPQVLRQVFVHPVPEGVGLDLDPHVLVALDLHAAGRMSLRTPGQEAAVTYLSFHLGTRHEHTRT